MGQFISKTIESVLLQSGDFEIEYIIIDGGSKDNTLDIIKRYSKEIEGGIFPIACKNVKIKYVSEKDSGMYDAINKGFSMATGEIFAWINSDDLYLPNALSVISKCFIKYPDIDWITGDTEVHSKDKIDKKLCYLYKTDWIKDGTYGTSSYFIHQESVFWRKNLWKKSGPIPSSLRYAGDFWLWKSFAKHAELFSLNYPVSIFNVREGQLSGNMDNYIKEQQGIGYGHSIRSFVIKSFFFLKRFIPFSIHTMIYKFFFNKTKSFVLIYLEGDIIKVSESTYVYTK